MDRCACCGQYFPPGATKHHSNLYQADNKMLCGECSQEEESAIEQEGTNDLPELLARYVMVSHITPDLEQEDNE